MKHDALQFGQHARYRAPLPHRHIAEFGLVMQLKEDLPKRSLRAESIRDFGGLYLVHGRYLLEPAVALGASFASMIDVTPRAEFEDRIRDAKQRNPKLTVEFVNADYRDYQLYDRLTPVEISLLYEVLLHQENYVDILKHVCSKTTKCICIAQPCIHESFFSLPGGAVLLQFYPEGLKTALRKGSFWPSEEVPTDHFVTYNWMWGHTTSHLIEVMHGLRWDLEYGEVIDGVCGEHWEFPLLRFVPRQQSRRDADMPAEGAAAQIRSDNSTLAKPQFTAHNIRLDDGTFTKPEQGCSIEDSPWALAARRILDAVFPGDKSRYRVADIGCLEGGFAVALARMGFRVTGIDVRESNLAACRYVKVHTNLPNLDFVKDDAWNIARQGPFDAVFCCGLFYHFDRPKEFLKVVSGSVKKLLILNTQFASERTNPKFQLSEFAMNEGMEGRWQVEFATEQDYQNRESLKWASWDNYRSFWVRREYLLQAIRDVGFDLVLEQFDFLGHDIVGAMTNGYYRDEDRGMFIGIKTGIGL